MSKWLHDGMSKRRQDRRQRKLRQNVRLRQLLVEVLEERLPLATEALLLKDINTLPNSTSFDEGNFVQVGGTLFFTATTSEQGQELWKTDGTEAGTSLVKDINPGTDGSQIGNLTNVGGTLFFSAYQKSTGMELWKSDGTTAGTTLVRDISSLNSYPTHLTNVNGTLFFRATDSLYHSKLWKTDGTSSGTVNVRNDLVNLQVYATLNVNGTLYFSGRPDNGDIELWKSDGTASGTVLVKNIWQNGPSSPTFLTNVDGTLYFRAEDNGGKELWKSDGTSIGTVKVKEIRAGSSGSYPSQLINVGGKLFFTANDGINGTEVWKSNGTDAGTEMVKNIGSGSTFPKNLTEVNGILYFVGNDATTGEEIWRSDGTEVGTFLVSNVRPGAASSTPLSLVNFLGTLYFAATDGTRGHELWRTDGSNQGTELVKDIAPGSSSSLPRSFTVFNSNLFFVAYNSALTNEMWKTDGTTQGTSAFRGIATGTASSNPRSFTNVNGTLFFQAVSPNNRSSLWKSDGTQSGTTLIKEFLPSYYSIAQLTNSNGTLYFRANDGVSGYELWKSDGSEVGTVIVKEIVPGSAGSNPGGITSVDGVVYFFSGNGLWKTDGSPDGTILLKSNVNQVSATSYNGQLTYVTNDAAAGRELWRSDGTTAGTVLIKNFGQSSGFDLTYFHNANGVLYFTLYDNLHGTELWKTDGTDQGTALVKDIAPGTASSRPSHFRTVGNVVYFRANDGTNGYELWKTNGTSAGTTMVRDIYAGWYNSTPSYLTEYKGTLYFNARGDTTSGYEPWKSDGTNSGTVIFRDIAPGGQSSYWASMANLNGTMYFKATDSTHGIVLWRTDGTIAGTTSLSNLLPDKGMLNPTTWLLVGSNLFYTSITNEHGVELWRLNENRHIDITISSSSISENLGPNAVVGSFASTDVNAGDVFSYELVTGVGGTDNALFSISNSTLRAVSNFDFESKSSYSIRVRSTDQEGLFLEKVLTISINDINESPLELTLSKNSLAENSGDNALVGTLSTTDQDSGNTFTYALVAGSGDADNGAFNIVGSTLRANSSFDFENRTSYTVRIRSTDQGSLFIEKAFAIAVTNVNETPTDIVLSPSTIVENAGTVSTVGNLSTVDPDEGNTFTYTLEAGTGDTDNTLFSIVGATLKANNSFDYETRSTYSIRVRSTDQDGLFVEKVIAVTVTNSNETPSDILLSQANIAENAGANASVGTLTTTDPDAGEAFSYTLVFGAGDTDNAAFNISGSTLLATNNFNFENKSSYSIRVRSTDQGGQFTEKAFNISVTNVNEAPTDISLSQSSIPENAGSNAVVGSLVTSDADRADSFSYSLVAGAGDSDNAAFNISGTSLRATDNCDFESKSSYSVRVRSIDQGGLSIDKVFLINVTNLNEAPFDIALSQLSIAENSVANSTVGTLSTNDPDSGASFTYSLVPGSGDNDNVAFSIAGGSLKATASFDFEGKPSYSIRIRSTDQGGLFTEKSFVITVVDVNESPTDISLSQLSIAENAGLNASVGSLTTEDPDTGNAFSYALVPGSGDGDNGLFNIAGSTLRAASSFDFEAKSTYSIRIRSTDQAGLFAEKSLTISVENVNEDPTDLLLSTTSIGENQGSAAVGTFITRDLDGIDVFIYTLVAGIGDNDNSAFSITNNILSAKASFDFETKSSFTVRVRSTDQGGLFTEKAFTINVMDINETPVDIALSQSSIAENVGSNATVGMLSSIDPDTADAFSYALVSGAGDTNNSVFAINGSTLHANSSFNFEAKSSYTVRVRSTDRSGLFFERNFLLAVTDVNEAPIGISISESTLGENAGTDAKVGTLSTLDPDAGDIFSYSLVTGLGGTDNGLFNISDDALRANNSFDFESKSSYTIRIRATDSNGLSTEKSFVVTIADRNESPTDLAISKSFLAENAGQNTGVGVLSSTDPDSGNTFAYTLVAGVGDTDNSLFNLNGLTLRAVGSFDFETKPSYSVRIRSTDQGGLFTEKVFTISVVDLNEAPLSVQLSNSSVAEGLPTGTEVGTLSASDPDAVDTFSFLLVAGPGSDDNSRFTISNNKLKTNAVFDYQSKSSYSVRVRAIDKGNLSTQSVLRIDVLDTSKPRLVSVERSKSFPNPTNGTELEFTATFSEAVSGVGTTSFLVIGNSSASISEITSLSPSSYLVRVSGGDLESYNGTVKIAVSSNAQVQDLSGNILQTLPPAIDEAFLVDHVAPNVAVNQQIANRIRPTISGTVSEASALIRVTVAGRNYTAVNDGNGQWSLSGTSLLDPLQAGRNEVAVSARDAAGNTGQDSTSQEILVILQAPTDLQFLPERVHDQMNSLSSDILFGQFSASDLDPVDQLNFRLVTGTGDKDNSSFFISGNSIYLRKGQTLNYDIKPQYSVRVECFDLAGNNVAAPIQLKLQPLPTANDDRFALVQGRQMVIDVKANDIAPDNNLQQLFVLLVGQSSSSIGKVEVTVDNRILLTANSNAYGVLTVIYRLSDPRGGESRDAKIQFGVSSSSKQNPWFQLDVNDNGLISPSDALMIINVLNDPTSERIVPDGLPSPAYLDVNGDKRLSPSDALLVINHLNSKTASEGEIAVDYTDLSDLQAKEKKKRLR